MSKYKLQYPSKVSAQQFTYPPSKKFIKLCGPVMRDLVKYRHPEAVGQVDIQTFEGWKTIREGYWVISYSGKINVMSDEYFTNLYISKTDRTNHETN